MTSDLIFKKKLFNQHMQRVSENDTTLKEIFLHHECLYEEDVELLSESLASNTILKILSLKGFS